MNSFIFRGGWAHALQTPATVPLEGLFIRVCTCVFVALAVNVGLQCLGGAVLHGMEHSNERAIAERYQTLRSELDAELANITRVTGVKCAAVLPLLPSTNPGPTPNPVTSLCPVQL